jgi:hypothetical protein
VIESGAKYRTLFAFDDLHEPLVLVVDDHGDEAALIEPGIVLEEVLVDADLDGPRVLPGAASKLELLVEHAMKKGRGASVDASNSLEVAEVLAGPEQAFAIALGGAVALAYALDRLGERTTTRATRKPSLLDPDERLTVAQRVVTHLDPAMIVDAAGQCGAARANLERRRLLSEERDAAAIGTLHFEQSEFRQQQVPR